MLAVKAKVLAIADTEADVRARQMPKVSTEGKGFSHCSDINSKD